MDVKTYINGIIFQNKSVQNGYILTTHNILRFLEPNLNIRIFHSNERGLLLLKLFKCHYFLFNNALLKLIIKQIF